MNKTASVRLSRLQSTLNGTISNASLEVRTLPNTSLQLFLLNEDYPSGPLPHEEMLAVLRDPAYWTFCWASGQVLAQFILKHVEQFKNKTVLDFGAGSGVVGIAAALAGAKQVICCDTDPDARQACLANAALNNVAVETLADIHLLPGKVDWLIAADVLYDRENFPWITKLPAYADQVIIADSRVKQEKLSGYEVVETVVASTLPDLDEFKDFNTVRIYRR